MSPGVVREEHPKNILIAFLKLETFQSFRLPIAVSDVQEQNINDVSITLEVSHPEMSPSVVREEHP